MEERTNVEMTEEVVVGAEEPDGKSKGEGLKTALLVLMGVGIAALAVSKFLGRKKRGQEEELDDFVEEYSDDEPEEVLTGDVEPTEVSE